MRRLRSVFLPLLCVVLAATTLSGCRESEQGRVLSYKKGEYLGKPDTELNEDQLNALSGRVSGQSFN
ncbi:MAG: hypothetical protein QNJ92_03140 [Alphaproteobacteria bacterium]|nr:hypothetical protein [Alphaproteobacteria bacterium]